MIGVTLNGTLAIPGGGRSRVSISLKGQLEWWLVSLDTRFIASHEELGTIIDTGSSFQSLAMRRDGGYVSLLAA